MLQPAVLIVMSIAPDILMHSISFSDADISYQRKKNIFYNIIIIIIIMD